MKAALLIFWGVSILTRTVASYGQGSGTGSYRSGAGRYGDQGSYGNHDRVKFTDTKALTFRAGIQNAGHILPFFARILTFHEQFHHHIPHAILQSHHEHQGECQRFTCTTDEMHQRPVPPVPYQYNPVQERGRRRIRSAMGGTFLLFSSYGRIEHSFVVSKLKNLSQCVAV